ncbi:hypothetical protein [Qipengyuania gaetbuli]|uniref:hypothetical protein n=1 Tax=Qipengyuania gaetbuli TaxID=266952 RepID=UPI001CD219E2|nr:hypothetical protein [Qipengyuania gaetbuli]MCA0910967.1 hypothetical protein [Qipengyuania gaetbuli]
MEYKGDLVTRASERFSDWAWSGRVSPRTLMIMTGVWLVAVWGLSIVLILKDAEIENFWLIMMLMPGNLVGLAGLGHRADGPALDEWQKAMRLKAFMWGGNLTLAGIALFAALAMGLADNSWFWQPLSEKHWMIVFLLIATTWMCLTSFAAAWLTPAYAAGIDEYE